MAEQGEHGITWCTTTWNPIRGCTRVSEGCRNCYAERVAARFSAPGQPYEGLARIHDVTRNGVLYSEPRWTGKVAFIEEHLRDPLRWTRPRMVFVNSMSDLFHEGIPDEWIDKIFTVMALATRHRFQVLTKRPKRMRDYLQRLAKSITPLEETARAMGYTFNFQGLALLPWPLPNVWIGVSVEDQKTADERVPMLLETPAAIRWLSYEPALGPTDFTNIKCIGAGYMDALTGRMEGTDSCVPCLDWIICGGESGPGARPMHPDWARSCRDQCAKANVPFFFKQWGEFSPVEPDRYRKLSDRRWSHESFAWARDGSPYNPLDPPVDHFPSTMVYRVGKREAGDYLDGVQYHEFPQGVQQ